MGRELKGLQRHAELHVVQLRAGPELRMEEHLAAMREALVTRPQMVVLHLEASDAWAQACDRLLEAYRGAIVVLGESEEVTKRCSERWRQGGSWLWQAGIEAYRSL